MNPLEKPGQPFHLDLRNPNPRSSKSKDGPVYRISFEVDQETFIAFMDARTPGMYLACVATVIDGVEGAPPPVTEPVSAKPFSEEAETLHKSRVFGLVEFASAVGTDAEYHAWIQRRKSCVSRKYSEYVDGEGRCIAAHVRRASDAGTAFKPEFHQVPLTDEEHQLQHQHGEMELLLRTGIFCREATPVLPNAKDWLYEKAFSYRQRWVWETLKKQLGYSSWSQVPPHVLAEWCASKSPSLLAKLPRCYRDAKR